MIAIVIQLAVQFNSSCKITSNAPSEVPARGSSEPGLLLSPPSFVSCTEQSRKAASVSSERLHSVSHHGYISSLGSVQFL